LRNPQGYAVIRSPDGPLQEADTVTCSHCQRIVLVGGRIDPADLGGFCRQCMKHICGPCADKGICVPFVKKLETFEAKSRFHKAAGTILASLLIIILSGVPSLAADLWLTWADASSDETSFEVARATSIDGAYSTVATLAAGTTSYRDTLLTALQLYCYKLRSCNGSACSDYIGPFCAQARPLPGSKEFQ
jgi:hypothetical protein